MSTKIKSILLLLVFCLFVALSIIYKLDIIEQREHKKQESKIENEITEKEEIKKTEEIKEKMTEVEKSQFISLGVFKLTAYCPCEICCGKWAGGNTASGTKPTANKMIAVDTNVIPFGTKVVINGSTYIAEDTGSAINGNKIDIYMESHKAALNFGVQYAEVFVKKD